MITTDNQGTVFFITKETTEMVFLEIPGYSPVNRGISIQGHAEAETEMKAH